MLMAGEQEPEQPGKPTKPHKACQIMIMFPVEDDETALAVKKAVDAVVGDIKDKRYNFSINEM